jgi:hypothetical protein
MLPALRRWPNDAGVVVANGYSTAGSVMAVSVSGTLFLGLRNAFRGLGNTAASLLGIGFFVRAVRFFTSGLLSGLGNMGRAFGKMLTVFLLFVYNFFVVGNVSRVGHRSLYPTSGK